MSAHKRAGVGLNQAALARLAAMGHKIEFGSEAERLVGQVELLHEQLTRSDYQPEVRQARLQQVTVHVTQPANDARLSALERQVMQIAGQVTGLAQASESSTRAVMQAMEAQAMLTNRLADMVASLDQQLTAIEQRITVVQSQEYRDLLPVAGTVFEACRQ